MFMVSPFGFSSFFLGTVMSKTPFLYFDAAFLESTLAGNSTSLKLYVCIVFEFSNGTFYK